ncbi:hypothetical protein [Moritella sp. PE36]|uniref:hypothetical protein n=1 Tax=Moritella sp. PE36 TaxID=58051 RepID=UPI0002D3BCCF|nr:hypothetical protein [Moritella sp. PE36]
MARPVNKKAMLKKQCKEHESNIKKSLKLQGINYNTKAFEADVKVPKIDAKTFKVDDQSDGFKIRIYIIDYVYNAIADVKNNAFEFIDDEFCELHSLPNLDRFHDELSDAQAVFISLIVNELYPDMDGILDKRPNTAMLLLPALAHDKLNKARSAIEIDNLKKAESLIEEVRGIAEMIVIVHSYFTPEPYKLFNKKRADKVKKTSAIRSEAVKKSSSYAYSKKLNVCISVYAEGVKSLLKGCDRPFDSEDIINSCMKGFSDSTSIDSFGVERSDIAQVKRVVVAEHVVCDKERDFFMGLSQLALDFEERYEELRSAAESSTTVLSDFDSEDIAMNVSNFRRNLKKILDK